MLVYKLRQSATRNEMCRLCNRFKGRAYNAVWFRYRRGRNVHRWGHLRFSTQKIISKGKALTTKQDLGIGISNVILTLPQDQMQRVDLVALSTTLATNAIVEGIGKYGGGHCIGV